MASKVSVISGAFLLLGKKGVSSIDPNASPAIVQTASFLYDQWYPKILTDHHWRFAAVTSQLSQLTFTPAPTRFRNFFQLPTSPKYLTALQASRDGQGTMDYEIFQNVLACNEKEVLFEYIGQIGEEFWPPYFNVLMIQTIAAVIAMPVTQDEKIATFFKEEAKIEMNDAKVIDAQARTNSRILDDPFIRAHYGGSGSGFGGGRGCR